MRGGVVAGGVALLIIGIILFSMSKTSIGGVTIPGEGGGTMVGYHSEEPFFLNLGIGLAVVGFVVLIVGLAASKKEGSTLPQTQTVVVQPLTPPGEQVLLVCPECKTRVPSSSKFCSECGADLTPKQKENS